MHVQSMMDISRIKHAYFGYFIRFFIVFSIAFHTRQYVVVAADRSTTPNVNGEAVTKSKQQDSFYFDPAPISQDVNEGEEVRLRCDVSNRKHIRFSWTQADRMVANTSRRYQQNSDLRITRVDRELDAGSFRCIATNVTTGVSLKSIEALLNVQWIDKTAEVQLKQPKQKSEMALDIEMSLKCHVQGNPEPTSEWYKNKVRLLANDRIRFHKNRLKIMELKLEDNGVYSCKAKNFVGEADSTDDFLLNVATPGSAKLIEETFTKVALVSKRGRAVFHCQYENAIATEWFFGDIILSNTTDLKTILYPNNTLVINDVHQKDAGAYSCVGLNEPGASQIFVAELVLSYLEELSVNSFEPKLPPSGRPTVVPIGKKFEVRCFPPQGLPTPSLRWESPVGGTIPESGRLRSLDNVLYINNAQEMDTGNYTCTVQNMARESRQNYWIVVSVPPRIARRPISVRVEEGQTANFDCKITGTPYPVTTITWRKQDFPLDMSHSRFVINQKEGTLKIKDVTLADEGNYACSVNTTGHPVQTSNNAHLYIQKRLKFKPVPVNSKLELDSRSKIHCIADGQSPPTVVWLRNGSPLTDGHVRDMGGVLSFDGVERSDAGQYTCVATSDQGRINATITVEVVVKPKFKVKPANTTAYEGYPMMLHCMATGDPLPTIQWDKNSKVNALDMSRYKVLNNGSLYVSEVYMEDMGKYGCTAGNSGGFEREEVYLRVYAADKYNHDTNDGETVDNFNMMKTIIIAVCSAVAYLAIVIGLTVYCSIRLVKAKNGRKQATRLTIPADKAENGAVPTEHTELMDKKDRDSSVMKMLIASDDARSHVSGMSSQPSHSSHSSRGRAVDKFSFPRQDLQTLGMLGKGHYGDVFLAKAHGIKNGEKETLVVVKSLLSRDEPQQFEFRREMDMLSKLNHENIAKLLGVCREMEPQFLITEYCEWGDLKQFLWATRPDAVKRNVKLPPLTMAQKITMCSQVALAMEHLTNHRFVHKDLAARNILLSASLDLKVTSLNLCRDVYAGEYFPFHQQLIPLRWMPPEAVLEDEFSHKSDVWSFGVFIWEVFTLGDLPYRNKADDEVLRGLKSADCQLDPLSNCPEEIVQLIRKCTCELVKDRPSFSEAAVYIGELTVDSDV